MLLSRQAVQDNIRNREGKRVFYLGKGDRLTCEARDWLTAQRIPILPGESARPDCYRLLGGGTLTDKPEHMTHLWGNTLVEKTHPRIVFRGKMDTLESELILCQLADRDLAGPVGELLDLARRILRCDVLEEPLEAGTLLGLTEGELRRHSHFPQEYYGQPHFMPSWEDGPVLARLNRARCAAREAELAAAAAFREQEHRLDILRAMNRMSSGLYILMVRRKAGKNNAQ